MDNRQMLTDMLSSYCRKQITLSGSAHLNKELQRETIEDICEGVMPTLGDSPKKEEVRKQYVSFLTEAAPIVDDRELKYVSGLGGGILSMMGAAMPTSYVSPTVMIVSTILGAAIGGIVGYKWGEYATWDKPVKQLIDVYARRLDRIEGLDK
ncbi:MAG: hypothetical protein AABX05_02710 [Nanoarchaeota archaeon]